MPRTKKKAVTADQMELNLHEATRNLTTVIEKFTHTLGALMQERPERVFDDSHPQPFRGMFAESFVSDPTLRRRINKTVAIQAAQKRLRHREIYILLFDRLYQETGFNAITHAVGMGDDTYLDAIQRKGLMAKTLEIATNM